MTNPTSNYSFQMPTASDLVTDLPADFEVFGQAVDTRLKALQPGTTLGDLAYSSATANTNTRLGIGSTGQILTVAGGVPTWAAANPGDITGVTAGTGISGGGTSGDVTVTNAMATAITTNGDLIYGTGSGTFTRRGIGSTNDVLTVSGGVPTWAAPASSSQNFALLNSGGTTLSGTTTTVSSISGKGTILVVVVGAGVSVSGSTQWKFRINTDTGLNYNYSYTQLSSPSSYAASNLTAFSGYGDDSINSGTSNGASARWNGAMTLAGCNSAGVKTVIFNGSGDATSNSQVATWGQGHYNSASTISSVSIYANGNTMNAGKIYVYASA